MYNSDIQPAMQKRLMILCTTTGYQTRAFVEAAEKLGLAVAFATDRCHVLDDPWQDGAVALQFEDPESSAQKIVEFARTLRVDGLVSLGDRPTPTAARAARALSLPHHPPAAADICRDKSLSRERLRAAGLEVPPHFCLPLSFDPIQYLESAGSANLFPCVLKPRALSGSRGVIRADNPREFTQAFERIRALLRGSDVMVMREDSSYSIQIESYIDGVEIAVEGFVDRGQLQVLALFDKPDPLEGPYFEETIYVTPSRLKPEMQSAVVETTERAARALGLHHGPLHAELRLNARGVWVLEVAARSIGGLCSRALRFTSPETAHLVSLEELIIRLALGQPVDGYHREEIASGVMMIPIPDAGILERVEGVEEALETPGVEDIRITAKPNQKLVPLPEGSSYLGFIFARAASPGLVEGALRRAHQKLHFVIARELPVV